MGYESSAEKWSSVQSVEKVLLSVVSMLAGDPVFIIVLTSLLHFPLILFVLFMLINL